MDLFYIFKGNIQKHLTTIIIPSIMCSRLNANHSEITFCWFWPSRSHWRPFLDLESTKALWLSYPNLFLHLIYLYPFPCKSSEKIDSFFMAEQSKYNKKDCPFLKHLINSSNKRLSRNDVTFIGWGESAKKWRKVIGGRGVSALLSKPKVTSFLDSPLVCRIYF